MNDIPIIDRLRVALALFLEEDLVCEVEGCRWTDEIPEIPTQQNP